ncbi:AraC family transcriptional regulator [Aetokthonos hydrillicola Thurmond2011]|uniref:AraC family transcriptional regulator n=2 Tax=Aetokthonos TaxID=1550243 RepID=A0AAP5M9L1_9CYAN|nr:helix-turn-helix transcriptional regulator [Aetokthonos hydrillicola CCALA 1050]MBW4589796.1 AraC family transcriptional regulator [Aetokthonos hydrillicola CCALA 1050]MDR9900291.1 AraC family transcriptional regulator [Aetokthonos hydrillicola Thurmond2011]
MSVKQHLLIDCVDWSDLVSNPPLLDSFQQNWNSIQLAHCRIPSVDIPEISNSQHVVVIPVGHQVVDLELVIEGHWQTISYKEKDFSSGCIELFPANLPHKLRCHTTVERMELIHCYLEPKFLAEIAYESVNPDRVELLLTPKKADPLIAQIGLALKSSLEVDAAGSRFYADVMATAMAAHLLRGYSTRNHCFREYEDGLSRQKLKQVIEYIQSHLGENLSLSEIANELSMSQYYFCRLFKRSTGMSPHQYLIHQRVEWAKHLLKDPEQTITDIAFECGFANPSHFAKYFRQCTGMNPKEFRKKNSKILL